MFPDRDDDAAVLKAIAVCAGCTAIAREACAEIVRRERPRFGVWNGRLRG